VRNKERPERRREENREDEKRRERNNERTVEGEQGMRGRGLQMKRRE
jgi:hypothetical protein